MSTPLIDDDDLNISFTSVSPTGKRQATVLGDNQELDSQFKISIQSVTSTGNRRASPQRTTFRADTTYWTAEDTKLSADLDAVA